MMGEWITLGPLASMLLLGATFSIGVFVGRVTKRRQKGFGEIDRGEPVHFEDPDGDRDGALCGASLEAPTPVSTATVGAPSTFRRTLVTCAGCLRSMQQKGLT